MDSLVNYGSEGENSNNSDDIKMPQEEDFAGGRASDVNYDPVQMDMSEESNNNNSSNDSDSERGNTPVNLRTTDKPESKNRSSPSDQRSAENENNTTNNREEQQRDSGRREQRLDSTSGSNKRNRRSSHEESRAGGSSRDCGRRDRDRDSRRSRDEDRRGSRDERRDKANDDKDKDHYHRDERRDRDRERSDRERRRERERDRERERERRSHQRDDRSQKERSGSHRDDRSSHHKEKDRPRTRSRSRERAPPSFRSSSYREEKGRSKLAQLEKLGIELKPPEHDASLSGVPGEQHYYNPLTTASQGKYAEQIQKRKLLWANKNKQDDGKPTNATNTTNTWVGTTFTHDQDGKVSAKFKRLMGIKEDLPVPPVATGAKPEILKKQEEMFNNMEQQYEVARATTHTQRGVGLGYATGGYQFPR